MTSCEKWDLSGKEFKQKSQHKNITEFYRLPWILINSPSKIFLFQLWNLFSDTVSNDHFKGFFSFFVFTLLFGFQTGLFEHSIFSLSSAIHSWIVFSLVSCPPFNFLKLKAPFSFTLLYLIYNIIFLYFLFRKGVCYYLGPISLIGGHHIPRGQTEQHQFI